MLNYLFNTKSINMKIHLKRKTIIAYSIKLLFFLTQNILDAVLKFPSLVLKKFLKLLKQEKTSSCFLNPVDMIQKQQ